MVGLLLSVLFALPLSAQTAKPRLAIVIDDFGLTYKKNVPDEDWMRISWPVTFAVMPESPRTKEAARQAKGAGHELVIHFPFDPFLSLELPKDKVSAEDVEKVRKLLDKAYKQIPSPAGLNNHRSYKATKNRPLMAEFMRLLKPRGGYFLDSKVSEKSAAFAEAQAAGIPAVLNWIFLDTAQVHTKEFCVKNLRQAAARARKRGEAVAIGHHYFHGTYECLTEEVPKLQKEGFEFVFASALAR
ncbi:MAG: divergent polysaccharide deacetylase family protein [Elusimicrobia bacterium]|nr:divergent polysaccharide deacetylase family protein [Elusimicrobiota bacterium]